MTRSRDLAALDANVLVCALYADAEHYRAARLLVDQARSANAAFCLTPQGLVEFYSVVTNPRRVTEAKAPEAILDVITNLVAMPGLTLLPFPLDLVNRWTALLRQHPVTGCKVFDVQLVATLLPNGVKKLYTFNRVAFEPFAALEVLTPVAS
jgi:predicted nucleic acid-binding protein